ncbi:MAG: DUF2007 domain-containing protein [Bacteroidales bacterium]|nr:DUF2007 domain-containing protein [Bacteroidales bacterium]
MTNDNWAVVATFNTQGEAYIAKGMLESNGIESVLNNATISSVYPMTDTWTPLELLVPADKIEEARKLLG